MAGKGKPGPKGHEPTPEGRRQVEMLSAYGLKQDAIAAIMGISDVTLRKHYAHEIEVGLSKVVAQVANSLVKKALSDRNDSVNAAKFFLQSQAGWTERRSVQYEDKTPERMTDDELERIAATGGAGIAASQGNTGKPH